MTEIDRGALASLAAAFCNRLLLPGDDGYDAARRVHNGMIDRHPAVIARCLGTADVVDALGFAVEGGLEIAVRSGGHNVAGRAVCDDGLMIDLSLMKGSHVDPKAGTVRVQAGVTWGEFNRETQLHGLATTGGAVSSTGVAGLTLGGGFGFLMGKHGLTLDSLIGAELVTADGSVVHASENENGELFWGLRGGGGNFGIVTALEFALHPVGPLVQGGMIAFPFDQAEAMLGHYRELTDGIPDELTVAASLTHSHDGQRLAAMLACHCGPKPEAVAALQTIKAFGDPVVDRLGALSYTALNQILDPGFPRSAQNYWKSNFIDQLSDDVIEVLVEQFGRCPSSMSKLILEHMHGAVLHPRPSDTAFPHRTPGYSVLIIAQWREPEDSERNIAWAKETYAALEPFLRRGVYSNYMSDDENLARVELAYGVNFSRLQGLKARYDPTNLFHNNQNIPPRS
jgi:FAD/FMN-containing dehydrogenase